MTARVGVPVPVVYGGIAAIVGLLLVVGFLTGRASSGGGSPWATGKAQGASGPGPAAAEPPAIGAGDVRSATHAETPYADGPPAAGGLAATPASSAVQTAAGAAPATPALRGEVAEYFRKMDATQSAAKTWTDPTALAQEVLAQAMRGDSGGFDSLIAASARARDGVRTMTVPAPCAEHHRLTLALLGDAVAILTRLREGVVAGDPSAVAGIASSGSALEGRARAVDELGAALRSQYGVAAAP